MNMIKIKYCTLFLAVILITLLFIGHGLRDQEQQAFAQTKQEQSLSSTGLKKGHESSGEDYAHSCASCSTCLSQKDEKEPQIGNPPNDEAPRAHLQLRLTEALQETLFSKKKGDSFDLQLPGGEMIQCAVEGTRAEAGRIVMVQGTVNAPQEGFFFFQKQSMPGVAGGLVGVLHYNEGDYAYRVEPQADGQPALVKHPVDSVICRKKEEQLGGRAEMPSEHPDETNNPSYQNKVPLLESLKGATGVIYLDFDGEEGPHQGWQKDGYFDAAPWLGSINQIKQVWSQVAEDFAPFNLNVTTDLQVYLDAPENSRIRCIITPNQTTLPTGAGVAWIGSFNWTGDVPCWVFYSDVTGTARTISHEVGHTLGLKHDGIPSTEYYPGHGANNSPVSWGAIMGATALRKKLVQWSKGEYDGATNQEDDIAIIKDRNNNVAEREDHYGNNYATAGYLEILDDGKIINEGVISSESDRDAFRFRTAGGLFKLEASPAKYGSNLDLEIELLQADGTSVVSNNPDLETSASLEEVLEAGEYYLRVQGTGRGEVTGDGYSNYGSLGHYQLKGTIAGGEKPDRFSIPENSPIHTKIGIVEPRKTHGAAVLSYSITSGNEAGAINIIEATGELRVANLGFFNFEALSTGFDHPAETELFVTISNRNDSNLNESVRVVVTVIDVNEAHEIIGPSQLRIYKSLPTDTAIAAYHVQGEDNYNDPIAWAITSGNESGAFKMDASGQLIVANATALSAASSHVLEISGTDNRSPAIVDRHTVTINTLKWNPDNKIVSKNWTQESGVTASQHEYHSLWGGVASRAIDNNTSSRSNQVTRTTNKPNSWWEVDLGATRPIGSIHIYNRTEGPYENRLSNFRVTVLSADRTEVIGKDFHTEADSWVIFDEFWELSESVQGRYIRVQLKGLNNRGDGVLQLAEVLVNAPRGTNIARSTGAVAVQSSTANDGAASRAIDGNTNGEWSQGSLTLSDDTTAGNWLDIRLPELHKLEEIILFNRTDTDRSNDYSRRLSNFRISIWKGQTEVYGSNHFTDGIKHASRLFTVSSIDGMEADRVRIQLLGLNSNADNVLSLAEVKVLGEKSTKTNEEIIESWLVSDTGYYPGESDPAIYAFNSPFNGSRIPNALAALLGLQKGETTVDKMSLIFAKDNGVEYAHLMIDLSSSMEAKVDYKVYYSTDLQNWELCESAPSLISTSGARKKVRHRANDPRNTADKVFMRISINPNDHK